VPRVNVMEVRDVLGCRIVARVRAQGGFESLLGSPPTLSELVHIYKLPSSGAEQSPQFTEGEPRRTGPPPAFGTRLARSSRTRQPRRRRWARRRPAR
jgi:hypothetical protein